MKEWKEIDEVLDFAIESEEGAVQFYTRLAERAEKPWMREVFEGFAREEAGHKAKLLAVKGPVGQAEFGPLVVVTEPGLGPVLQARGRGPAARYFPDDLAGRETLAHGVQKIEDQAGEIKPAQGLLHKGRDLRVLVPGREHGPGPARHGPLALADLGKDVGVFFLHVLE